MIPEHKFEHIVDIHLLERGDKILLIEGLNTDNPKVLKYEVGSKILKEVDLDNNFSEKVDDSVLLVDKFDLPNLNKPLKPCLRFYEILREDFIVLRVTEVEED